MSNIPAIQDTESTQTPIANVRDCGKETDMNNHKITILYERLSAEDEKDMESNSIKTQRAMLEDYAERHGFIPYIHATDDGYSGTNWNRPGWQEVMNRVEAGEVSCLLVKDSSRLGRDFLRVGLIRERFQELGVRLIAINDGLDTAKGDDDFTPFRDLISEWYARDTSRKIKSSLEAKGKKGVPMSNRPPYGYRKNPLDRTKWEVDEYAANIVRRIFNMVVEGKTAFEIVKILNAEKIERPSYYMDKMGYFKCAKSLENANPYDWSEQMIDRMLKRREYCGAVVNFKTKTPSFKSRKQVHNPQEEWVIFEEVHERIVPQETWDLVQKLRSTKRRPSVHMEEGANPLTGLLWCSDCGKKLFHHRTRKGKLNRYCCSTYNARNRSFKDDICSLHHISVKAVQEIILEAIKKTASFVRDYEDEFVKMLRENATIKQCETIKSHNKQINKCNRRITELDKLFGSLYEDKVKGVLTEERFIQMSKSYEEEQAEQKAKLELLQNEINDYQQANDNISHFIKLVKRHTHFEELTTPLLNEFVDKVIVHEAVWSDSTPEQHRRGTRTQQIDVYLKYIGHIALPDKRTQSEIEAERIEHEKWLAKNQKANAYRWEYTARKKAEKAQQEAKAI